MSLPRRYFRLTGMLLMIATDWQETVWERWIEDMRTFFEEAGTDHLLCRARRLVAIATSETSLPGLIACDHLPGYSIPDESSPEGRILAARFASLTEPLPVKLLEYAAADFVGDSKDSAALSVLKGEYFISIPRSPDYRPLHDMVEISAALYREIEAAAEPRREEA